MTNLRKRTGQKFTMDILKKARKKLKKKEWLKMTGVEGMLFRVS